jgi:hypothetical protein
MTLVTRPAITFALPVLFTLALLVTGLQAIAAPADTTPGNIVYVTDELRLGLYRTEETTGRSLKTLVSGSRLEILERSLMSIRVRGEDGDEGWVKTAYVVASEPARRRLAGLENLQAETESQLAARSAEVAQLTNQIDAVQQELAEAVQGIADLPAVRAENEDLKLALNAIGIQIPLLWVALATLAALVAGIMLGYWWLDRRVRKKFGGVRVY